MSKRNGVSVLCQAKEFSGVPCLPPLLIAPIKSCSETDGGFPLPFCGSCLEGTRGCWSIFLL